MNGQIQNDELVFSIVNTHVHTFTHIVSTAPPSVSSSSSSKVLVVQVCVSATSYHITSVSTCIVECPPVQEPEEEVEEEAQETAAPTAAR